MKSTPNIIAVIPARGGSKGLPGKALKMLGDKPLIAYTINDALSIHGITKIFVSTDDPEIQSVSIEYGAEVPFLRPKELAQDDSRLDDAIKYSFDWYSENEGFERDIEIIMSPTQPFRRYNLINNALKRGVEYPEILNIGSVAPANVKLDNYWICDNGNARLFTFPKNGKTDLDKFYQSSFSFNIVFPKRNSCHNGRIAVVLNEIESIDIDEPEDFEIARMVISEGVYPFS